MDATHLHSMHLNGLLAALAPDDAGALAAHLEPIALGKLFFMERPGEAIPHIYFPLSGMVSVVAVGDRRRDRRRDQRIEAGVFGREGVSGLAVVLGGDRSPHETYVQIAGHGLRLRSDALREVMGARAQVQRVLLLYVQAWMIQCAHTVLAQGHAKLEERLARWLLMSHDRCEGDDLPLTHDFLALMLGVRRAGVTMATHELEAQGMIRATRGRIRVVDREGLTEVADGCYGVPEAEYRRLLGPLDQPGGAINSGGPGG